MKRYILMFTTLLALPAMAQQIRVEKVKGNKAVVEFSGTGLTPGKTYSLGGSGFTQEEGSTSRDYILGGSIDMKSLSSSNSLLSSNNSYTSWTVNMRFGWNMGHVEVGPILAYTSSDNGSTSSRFKGGAFADYNFTANQPGIQGIFGVGGNAYAGSDTPSSGSSGSLTEAFASAFYKWFPGGGSVAIRGDAGYLYQKISYSASSVTNQGFDITGGLYVYF